MSTFDKNQCKEFIGTIENHTAEFIGSEQCAARLIGYISEQTELGELNSSRSAALLNDAYHLLHLAKLGHRFAKMVRHPTPEMRIMILAEEQRERRCA